MTVSLQDLLAIPEARRRPLLEIASRIRSARNVILTTHVNADGDGAGSEVALAAWLEQLGARVRILNPTPFPPGMGFLLFREGLILELDEPGIEDIIRDADVILVVDTSEPRRIEPLDRILPRERMLVIDHHLPGPDALGEGVRDASAAATGEIVYDLLTLAGDEFPQASVLGIYVAIVTDTGSFRFSNTGPRAHLIAADLLARGVDPEAIFQQLFAVNPPRRVQLLREALDRLEHEPELGIAWMVIPLEVTDRLQTLPEDYEGLIEHARSIEGTRIALLFRETAPNETKISFRSTGPTDVNRLARMFGGGGHAKASGATVSLAPNQAVERVLARVRETLRAEDE